MRTGDAKMSVNQEECIERAMRLRRMMKEYLRSRSPQERDRIMQVHLAQARGPAMNALLLRQTTNAMLRLRAAQNIRKEDAGG